MDPTALLASSGLLVVFLVLLLKEAGVPIPVPGDLIIITAGIQAAAGSLNLAQAIAVILLAGLVGTSVQYGIARGPGRRFIHRFGRYAGLPPSRLDRLTRGLRSRGARSVALTRITPGVRTATAVAAGLAGVPYRSFLLGIGAGSLVWILFHALLGYFAGPTILQTVQSLQVPVLPLLVGGAVLALGVWFLINRRQRIRPAVAVAAWADAACPACLVAGAIAQTTAPSSENAVDGSARPLLAGDSDW